MQARSEYLLNKGQCLQSVPHFHENRSCHSFQVSYRVVLYNIHCWNTMYNCRTPFLSAVSEVFVINSNSGVRLNKNVTFRFSKKQKKYICCMSKPMTKIMWGADIVLGWGGGYCRVTKKKQTQHLSWIEGRPSFSKRQRCCCKCWFLIFDKSIVCGIVCVCEYDGLLLRQPPPHSFFILQKHFVRVTK